MATLPSSGKSIDATGDSLKHRVMCRADHDGATLFPTAQRQRMYVMTTNRPRADAADEILNNTALARERPKGCAVVDASHMASVEMFPQGPDVSTG